MSIRITIGRVMPIKKKTTEGLPVFSGMFEVYDHSAYMKLAAMFGKDADVVQCSAQVMDSKEVILKNIHSELEKINDGINKLLEPPQFELFDADGKVDDNRLRDAVAETINKGEGDGEQ